MTGNEQKLNSALSEFITAMRILISTELQRTNGADWERIYFDTLSEHQKKIWGDNRAVVDDLSLLIDFGNLYPFAIKNRFFHEIVGRGAGGFPSKFADINEARNMMAHYGSWDQDKADLAFGQMIDLAKKLEMNDLELKLRSYKKDDAIIDHPPKPPREPEDSEDPPKPKSFKKSDAIDIVNNDLGNSILNNSNTVFSNINRNGDFWWLNISPKKFNSMLNIILVENNELIWISNLSDEVCVNYTAYFNTRDDNGKIDLYIDAIEGNTYLKETRKGKDFDFSPMIVKRIPIT
jgi:hypothetical protein